MVNDSFTYLFIYVSLLLLLLLLLLKRVLPLGLERNSLERKFPIFVLFQY